MDLEKYFSPKTLEELQKNVFSYGTSFLKAAVVFWVGRKLIAKYKDFFSKFMVQRNVDPDLRPFLLSITTAVLNITLIMVCTNLLGIETTSFVAILSAASLAVGFALQGSLSNFASGVLLLVFKPFGVNDIINIQGVTGKVTAIRIFDTVVVTPDNKTIVVPNGKIFSGNITNFTAQGSIRVDMSFAASNQHPADTVRAAIQKAVEMCPFALPGHGHDIMIGKLNDKAVQFDVSVWTTGHTYWDAYYFVHEAVYRQFTKEGINAQGAIK